ncbi:MAG TPA: hypothetical protein VF599_14270 [Pyrinomonadaceae bacterium]
MKKIEEFSEAHRTGFGWSAMYVRNEEPPQTLASLLIPFDSWKENLKDRLSFHAQVKTGYSSHVETCDNCAAWAGENDVTIFAEINQDAIRRAWFSFDNLNEQGVPNSLAAIREIAERDELIIVDWVWREVVKISDAEKLSEYLQSRA